LCLQPKDNKPLADDTAYEINNVTATNEIGLVEASATGKSFKQQQAEKAAQKGGALPSGGLGDILKGAVKRLFEDAQKDSTSGADINSLLAYPVRLMLACCLGISR
jgi:hypothetical protein